MFVLKFKTIEFPHNTQKQLALISEEETDQSKFD